MTSPEDVVPGEAPAPEVASTPVTREALYALAWSEPMLKVAARYGVSSSYLARICALLNGPRPQPGYWSKLAVGRAPKKPALPDARPGDELVWSRDRDQVKVKRPLPRPPACVRRKRHKLVEPRPDQHPLIRDVKSLFEYGRVSHDSSYLKPAKKLLVDLTVSKTGLDKALSFANQLFLSLESNGYRVVIAPPSEPLRRAEVDEREEQCRKQRYSNLWSPWRCTVVYTS